MSQTVTLCEQEKTPHTDKLLYLFGKCCLTGSFGTCQKIKRKSDGKILVWKVVRYEAMKKHDMKRLLSEVKILMDLDHPNIVKYFHHFVVQEQKKLYIVMEYCEGGDLRTLIRRFKSRGMSLPEDFVLHILVQLASALKHCHRRPDKSVVLHQDLKPANVFLDNNLNVKLGDFGLADVLPSQEHVSRSHAGTPLYMSPEKDKKKDYNERSDIWSLGCLMYELCAFDPPVTAGRRKKLKDGRTFRRIPVDYSDYLDSIIGDMLQVNASRRPSATDILHQLTDTFSEEELTSCQPVDRLPQPVSVEDLGHRKKKRRNHRRRRAQP